MSDAAAARDARAVADALRAAALAAADAGRATSAALSEAGDDVGTLRDRIDAAARLVVVAVGKAAVAMASACEAQLGDRIEAGVVVAPEDGKPWPDALERRERWDLMRAEHPLPDEGSAAAGERICALCDGLGERDLMLCLISGGGSALLCAPRPPLTVDDVARTTELLLRSGADIGELNVVRKHLEQLKGGGLAARAYPAEVVGLVLSDVVGSPLASIASGLTAGDTSTFAEAAEALRRRGIYEEAPPQVRQLVSAGVRGEREETVRPGAERLSRTETRVIGSARGAAEAACRRAEELGLGAMLLSTFVEGEARVVGAVLASVLREIASSGHPLARPCCVVAAGETTVTVRGSGRGGRNQELALGAVRTLAGLDDVLLATLATDGVDGPTDAAGAMVDGQSAARARAAGLDVGEHLAENNAYWFFEPLGDLVRIGPTGTNVNDLVFLIAL